IEIVKNAHQALRLRKRQRAQENSVNDGEDGDVCADTKSQGQQCDRGESRALQQGAQRVTRIVQGLFDPRNGPLVAMQFFGVLDAGSVTEDVELREKASHGHHSSCVSVMWRTPSAAYTRSSRRSSSIMWPPSMPISAAIL